MPTYASSGLEMTYVVVCQTDEAVAEVVRTTPGLRVEDGRKTSEVSAVSARQKGEEGLEHLPLLRDGEVRAARMPTSSEVCEASRPTRRTMRVAVEVMGRGGMTSPTTGLETGSRVGNARDGEAVTAIDGGPIIEVEDMGVLASSRAVHEAPSLLVPLATAIESAGPLVKVLRLPVS